MLFILTGFFEHWKEEFYLPLTNPVLIFSIILLIILLSPLILRKIKIPGIIGLIISGVIIGPNGFNLLAESSAVELFSTIGLLYIMFIAGLELDLNDFIANRHKSIVFGILTFILPLAIGYPVCFYLLNLDPAASLLTASMFSTHTLVAYPIVSKLGISKNQAIAVTVGGTIFTDTAVLIILAVVIGMHTGGLNNEFWIQLIISLIIFLGIMFFIIPRISRWFFKNLESEKYSHYIFVLSVVFFAAFLAEVAGLEKIIGAFVAGLTLNRLIPRSSALMNRIEFIGNSLFIPFFLISVGMIVDVRVITEGWYAAIIAGTLTAVAVFGKWAAAFFTRIIFRYTKNQGNLIFGLSSSHAAATLAVILVGYRIGILNENILNGTIILILITCIIASFMTERAGKAIAAEKKEEDIGFLSNLRNEHILLATNKIDGTERFVDLASMIRHPKSVQPLSILSVFENDNYAETRIMNARLEAEQLYAHASASETKINFIPAIDHNPAGGIIRTTKEISADLIILGWNKRQDLFSKMIGEKTDQIISNTDKTVFVCQLQQPFEANKRLVVLAPPLCELETGFSFWMSKVSLLIKELSLPFIFFCNNSTQQEIIGQLKKNDLVRLVNFYDFNEWQDFLILARYIEPTDFILFVSARKMSVSWLNLFDQIPAKLERYFEKNNKIIIFPQQLTVGPLNDSYKDINSEPLEIGIETIQKIGKGISSIFRKEQDREEIQEGDNHKADSGNDDTE
jgi:Kef-type K+ transport system membrane component KefB